MYTTFLFLRDTFCAGKVKTSYALFSPRRQAQVSGKGEAKRAGTSIARKGLPSQRSLDGSTSLDIPPVCTSFSLSPLEIIVLSSKTSRTRSFFHRNPPPSSLQFSLHANMLGNRRSKHTNYCPGVDTYRVPRIQRMYFTLYYLGLFQ